MNCSTVLQPDSLRRPIRVPTANREKSSFRDTEIEIYDAQLETPVVPALWNIWVYNISRRKSCATCTGNHSLRELRNHSRASQRRYNTLLSILNASIYLTDVVQPLKAMVGRPIYRDAPSYTFLHNEIEFGVNEILIGITKLGSMQNSIENRILAVMIPHMRTCWVRSVALTSTPTLQQLFSSRAYSTNNPCIPSSTQAQFSVVLLYTSYPHSNKLTHTTHMGSNPFGASQFFGV